MIMTVIALLIVASQSIASLHIVLSMNSTCDSKSLKTKLFQRVHYKFLCMVFQPFQVNFHALPLKPSKYFSFCDTVVAHEEVVVEFVIFHAKLSYPLDFHASSARH